jgi:hypothetical protein
MKFSQQIIFNSVPEWKDNYINYAQLKRLIYSEEAARLAAGRDVGEGRPGAFSQFGPSLAFHLACSLPVPHCCHGCRNNLHVGFWHSFERRSSSVSARQGLDTFTIWPEQVEVGSRCGRGANVS